LYWFDDLLRKSEIVKVAEIKENKKTLGRWKMLGILLVCAAPVLLSYFMYYVVRPDGRTNYGSLLNPIVDASKLNITVDEKPTTLAALKGKWLMVTVGPSSCDDACAERLYLARQVRETTGREKERIELVWVVTDAGKPSQKVLDAYPTVKRVSAKVDAVGAVLPVEGSSAVIEHTYIVDPLGNVILRFPAKPDPSKMKKDMSKLLRASRIG
jgi:cytochrome oxidase Cu insertion factor (SCO1/SenC/PrrC family)